MEILTAILGGGQGTRLYPLTRDRAKPAVPFGAEYRLVDVPISNSIHSKLENIFVLTQFNSSSLHEHITRTYQFDIFHNSTVRLLAAEQTYEHDSNNSWYQGTADAIRKNLKHFKAYSPHLVVILSGDQLYDMNLRDFVKNHLASGADISIATTNVTRKQASGLGLLSSDKTHHITSFLEKPGEKRDISEFVSPGAENQKRCYAASMGIYIFNANVLYKCLDSDFTDFGREVIPDAINKYKVIAFNHPGYWEDIGTISNFFNANLALAWPNPPFVLNNPVRQIYKRSQSLMPTVIGKAITAHQIVIGNGCVVGNNVHMGECVIGVQAKVGDEAFMHRVYLMGAGGEPTTRRSSSSALRPTVGKGTKLRNVIVDTDASIGEGCSIGMSDKTLKDIRTDNYTVSSGIIIIPHGVQIPDGTVI